MTFEEVVNKRKSIRNYSNKPVEIEKLIRICDFARLAPSSCNSQPWIMHIINEDSSELEDVKKACHFLGLNKFIKDVNSFIVVEQASSNLTVKVGEKFMKNDFNSIDLGILASYISLKATEEGLGSCILGGFRKESIQKAMNFKDNQVVRFIVAVGYTDENIDNKNTPRKDFEKVVKIHKK